MAGSGLLWLALTSCILTLASTSQHSDRIPRAAISRVQELSCGDPDTPEADDCFDPCENYTELDDPSRGTDSKERSETCDDHLSGWYRFQSDGGIDLLQECVPMFQCHTDAPLWLNGDHPTTEQGIVTRTVCAHWVENCCFWSDTVQVKACLDYSRYPDDPDLFYVYQLEPTITCELRYCTDRNSTWRMCKYPECRSVERCSYQNKEWSCRCREDYDDSEIQSLQPILQCGASEITLTIDTCLLGGLEIEELIGSLTNGKTIDIEPGSDIYSRNVIIPFDSFDYPDITENDAVYKDTITFKSTETESILLQVNFDCTYPLDYGVSPPNVLRPIVSPWTISVSGEGKFNVVMGFYDKNFEELIEDPEIELPVDSIVYVEVRLEEGDRGHFKTVLRNCYATADIYPVDYPLILDSCPNPDDLYIYIVKNGVDWKSQFAFQLFLLTELPHVLYLRCEVHLCGFSEEPCEPVCPERKGTDGTALGQTQEIDLRSTTWEDVQTFAALSGAPRTAGFLMAWPALLLPVVLVWLF